MGVSPVAILSADPLTRELWLEVAQAAVDAATQRDSALAARIINALAEALK